MEQTVQKYSKTARVFHWVHTGAFLLLVITGIFLFVQAGVVAQDSWSRLVHRIAAVIFVLFNGFQWISLLRGAHPVIDLPGNGHVGMGDCWRFRTEKI